MVRSARERASRTMGRLRRCRPWLVLRDGASRLLRTRSVDVAITQTPHGEERAKRASRTMGRLRRRPWPVLRDGASRLLRTRPVDVAITRTPHGEERGEAARLEPWAACAAVAPGPSFETALRASSGRGRWMWRSLEHLMVRSAAKPRVSNHGPLAPLSPAAQ